MSTLDGARGIWYYTNIVKSYKEESSVRRRKIDVFSCRAIVSRFILWLAMAVAFVCFAQTANAAASAKAVVYSDGRIVYYYDDVDHSADAGYVQLITALTSQKSPSVTVTSIVIDSSFADYQPTSLASYFNGLKNATSITGIENLNMSKVASMASMFRTCSALTSVDLSHFDTSKVTTMQYMFLSCSSLKELDISSFRALVLTDARNMFQGCSSITSIYASVQFDLSGLTDNNKQSVFYNCTNKLKGDKGTIWSSEKTSGDYGKVDGGTESPGLFSRVYLTLAIDASVFAAKHIASVVVTAEGTPVDPTEVGGSSFAVAKGAPLVVTYTAESGYEFAGEATYSDTTFAADGITVDTSVSGDSIPTATPGLSKYTLTIDDSGFAASHIASVAVTKSSDGSTIEPEQDGTYTIAEGIGFVITYTAEDGYEFNGSFTYADSTFAASGIAQDETRSGADIPTATVFPVLTLSFDKGAFEYRHISAVAVKDASGATIAASGETEDAVFYSITKFDNFTISYSAVPGYLFNNYISVTEDDTWQEAGFMDNAALSTNDVPATIDHSGSHVKGVVESSDPGTMTFYCDAVAHSGTVYGRKAATGYPSWMNLSTIQRVVIDSSMRVYGQGGSGFQYLFCGLSAVTNFEGLTNLRTANATSFYQMFYGCRSAMALDVSKFRTAKVTTFESMFRGCSSLKTVDLSSFSNESLSACAYMFNGCSSMTTIYARPPFNMTHINSSYVYTGCSKLVGGNGTTADPGLVSYARYSHIDEPGNPGYFTLKPYKGGCLIIQ